MVEQGAVLGAIGCAGDPRAGFVFYGTLEGYLKAVDAKTGRWLRPPRMRPTRRRRGRARCPPLPDQRRRPPTFSIIAHVCVRPVPPAPPADGAPARRRRARLRLLRRHHPRARRHRPRPHFFFSQVAQRAAPTPPTPVVGRAHRPVPAATGGRGSIAPGSPGPPSPVRRRRSGRRREVLRSSCAGACASPTTRCGSCSGSTWRSARARSSPSWAPTGPGSPRC